MGSCENNMVIISVFESFYQSSLSISDSFLLSPFPKQRQTMYYRVGGLLIMGNYRGKEKIKENINCVQVY